MDVYSVVVLRDSLQPRQDRKKERVSVCETEGGEFCG